MRRSEITLKHKIEPNCNHGNFNNAMLLYGLINSKIFFHFLYYFNLLGLLHSFCFAFVLFCLTKEQYGEISLLFHAYNYIEMNRRAYLWIDGGHTQYKERRQLLAHAERLADQLLLERKSTSQLFSGVARATPVPGIPMDPRAERRDERRKMRCAESAFHFTRPILQKRYRFF